MIVAFRLFCDRHFHNSMTTLYFVILSDAMPKKARRGHVIFPISSRKVIVLPRPLLATISVPYLLSSVHQIFYCVIHFFLVISKHKKE